MEIIEIIVCNVAALLGVVGALVWLIKRNKSQVVIKRDENSLVVSRNPSKKVLLIIAYFASIAGMVIDSIVYWFRYVEEFEFFAYFFVLLIVLAMSAHYLLNYYFDYVVATNKKVTDYRIGKKPITINLNTITNVEFKKTRVLLINKSNEAVASFHLDSLNGGAFVKDLYENHHIKVLEGILAYYQIELNAEDKEAKRIAQEKQAKANEAKNANKDANKDVKNDASKDTEKEDANKEEGTTEVVKEETETKLAPSEKEPAKKKKADDRYTENQIASYTLIGKEFRENQKRNKIIDIVKICVFQVALAAIVVGFILISHNYLMIILFGVNIFVALSKVKEYRIKYSFFDNDDFDLGLKFAYQCNRVKGYHRTKMKQTKMSSMLLSIVAIIVTAFNGYMTFTSKPIDYSDTVTITGELVEVKKDRYVDLKIKDLEEKYSDFRFTIPDSFNKYIDVEAIANEEVGQDVTIKATTKNNQGTVLYLQIGEDLYISQETLDKHYQSYSMNQKIIFFTLVGATIAILVGSFGYQWYLEVGIKKENIDLNN